MSSPGRNEPCPCGSGRKFKHCCGDPAKAAAPAPAAPVAPLLATAQAHHRAGRLGEAEAGYRRILAAEPGHPDALHLLGLLAHQLGRHEAALPLIVEAIRTRPEGGMFHNLGLVLRALGQLQAAMESFDKAIAALPGFADAHTGRAATLLDLGFAAEAASSYREAMRLAPELPDIHSGWLLAMQYLPDCTPARLRHEHARYAERFEAPLRGKRFRHPPPQPLSRPLRLGFVSGDLRTHPVGLLAQGVLARLPREKFELHLYSSHPPRSGDRVAEALRALGRWTPIEALSDEAAARRIHADGIDILVDLSGHTGHNRLPLFALKPAPVQVSWLGYTATTGLESIDWLVCDDVSAPDADAIHFSEKLWRIPGSRLCFTPPDADRPVAAPPLSREGRPTFGCFNNIAKLNDRVIALWARLLAAVPESRLFMKGRQFDQPMSRDALLEKFARAGVARDRIAVEGFTPRDGDYLSAYDRVDVALDPFPFTGGATTLDALWMGVPVVTLRGDSLVSRQGESVLRAMGADEWIARDHDDYLRIARTLVVDPARLAATRAGLRARLAASPVGDVGRYAQALAEAFEGMWSQYVAGASPR